MTQANDSLKILPDGTGVDVATHTPAGAAKEWQTFIESDADGHVLGTIPTYFLYQEPRVMTAAATDLWDFFVGASATHSVRLMGLWPLVTHSAASAFTTPWRFDVLRTSAVGTGGTTASEDAAAPTTGICSVNRLDTADPVLSTLDAQITARALPTGGATVETLLMPISLFLEEGSTANAIPELLASYSNQFPVTDGREHIRLRPGKGIKVRQITATASTGALVGWLMQFSVI